jgi:flagellar basal body-associated protein FliL
MHTSSIRDPLYSDRWYRQEGKQLRSVSGWVPLAVVLTFLTVGGVVAYTLAGHSVTAAKPTIGDGSRIVSPAAPTPADLNTAPAIATPVDH